MRISLALSAGSTDTDKHFKMSTVGPELPPHLVAKRKRQLEEEVEEGDHIPSNDQARKGSSSPSSDGWEKRRRVIGPSLPPAALEERPIVDPEDNNESSSDDDFGPALPTGRASQVCTIHE